MATFTVNGTLKDQFGDPIPGKTVWLFKSTFPPAVMDSDETDASGNYSVSTTTANTLVATWAGESPHYSNADGPTRVWNGVSNQTHTDHLVSTFSNNDPQHGNMANIELTENTGNQTAEGGMSDADSGDELSVVKDSGPSWGTLAKVSNTLFRWTFDTDVPSPGSYTFTYHVNDNFGGSSGVDSFDVDIEADNDPPVLTNPGTKTYSLNSGNQTFNLSASDPGDTLTYSKQSGPTWVSVNSSSGLVTVATNSATEGNFSVTWRVTDSGGLFDEETHTIVIKKKLSSNVSGAGSLSGSIKIKKRVAVSVQGVGSFTSALGVHQKVVANLVGSGGVGASMSYTASFASSLEGVGGVNAVLGLDLPGTEFVVAMLSGVGSVSSDLSVIPPTTHSLGVSLVGVGELSPPLSRLVPITSLMDGVGSLAANLNILGRTVMVRQELNKFGRWTQFLITHNETERIKVNGFLLRGVAAGEQRIREAGREVKQELKGFGRWTQFRFVHDGTEALKLEGFVLRVVSAGEYR